jgi:hypothetical protein
VTAEEEKTKGAANGHHGTRYNSIVFIQQRAFEMENTKCHAAGMRVAQGLSSNPFGGWFLCGQESTLARYYFLLLLHSGLSTFL